jgi:hypothetical protein
MIREFNEQWEKDYVRKTVETLQAQTVMRKSATEKNAQRDDIDEVMGEGGGDEGVEVILTRLDWSLETSTQRISRVISACLCPICTQKHQGGHGG